MNHFTLAFADELSKVAARKGVKIMRQLIAKAEKGDAAALAHANRLAKTKGVLKGVKWTTEEDAAGRLLHRGRSGGSQLKPAGLGGGGEQTATVVADPGLGIAVRKLHRGKGAPTKGKMMDARKALRQDLGDADEGFSKIHWSGRSPTKSRMQMHEYLPLSGKNLSPVEVGQIKGKAISEAGKKGWAIHQPSDIGARNIQGKMVGGKPTYRVVDAKPYRSGENVPHDVLRVIRQGGTKSPENPGKILRDAFELDPKRMAGYEEWLKRQSKRSATKGVDRSSPLMQPTKTKKGGEPPRKKDLAF